MKASPFIFLIYHFGHPAWQKGVSMNLTDWQILQSLSETHNMTKSAHQLFLSQPTLTKRLKNLEKEFGRPLIIRHAQGISFTAEGNFLVQKAAGVLAKYAELKDHIQHMSQTDFTGIIPVAANAPFARTYLPLAIAKFRKQYPLIDFDIQVGYTLNNYRRLYRNEIPLGFIREAFNWPFQKLLVAEEKTYVIANRPFRLQDLESIPEIQSRFSASLTASIEKWWHTYFYGPANTTIRCEDSSIAIEFVRQGLGYTIVPGIQLLGREKEFYRLPLRSPDGHYFLRRTWLYYKNLSLENILYRSFIHFLETLTVPDGSQPDLDAPANDFETAYI